MNVNPHVTRHVTCMYSLLCKSTTPLLDLTCSEIQNTGKPFRFRLVFVFSSKIPRFLNFFYRNWWILFRAKIMQFYRIWTDIGHFKNENCNFQWKIVANFLAILFFGRLKWELILIMQYQSWHKLSVKWVSLSHLPFFDFTF